jgi:hypothetical protein
MNDGQILIVSIKKSSKFDTNDKCKYESTKVGYDRQRLIDAIEKQYDIKLVKDEAYDFPWFTDGGFKFHAENENWKFDIDAHVHDLI